MPSASRCSTDSGVRSSTSIMPRTPFIGVRISWLTVARKVDLAWLALSASRCAAIGDVAREPRLVVGDLQAAGEILLLVGERDVVVLPAMDIAHIGHEMADIGAAGDADQLVERVDRVSSTNSNGAVVATAKV